MKILVPMFVALALAACANFDQKLASAYTATTATRTTAAAAVASGRVSSAQGENVLALTDQARKVLDTAAASKDKAALDLAIDVLGSVENFSK